MDGPDIPKSTLRVLASLLLLVFDLARDRATTAVIHLRPLVEPPDDLRVGSRIGALYSGVLVLDRGEVIVGLVVQTGQGIPQPGPIITPPPAPVRPPFTGITDRYSSEGRLRGWAEDPRDAVEEDSPWRR